MMYSIPNKLATFNWYEDVTDMYVQTTNYSKIITYEDLAKSPINIIETYPANTSGKKCVTQSYIENLFSQVAITINASINKSSGTYQIMANLTDLNTYKTVNAVQNILIQVNCDLITNTKTEVSNQFTIYKDTSQEIFYGNCSGIKNLSINSVSISPKCGITKGNKSKTHLYIPIIGNVGTGIYNFNIYNVSIRGDTNNSINKGHTNKWQYQFTLNNFIHTSELGTSSLIEVYPENIKVSAKVDSSEYLPTITTNFSPNSLSSEYTISGELTVTNSSDIPTLPTITVSMTLSSFDTITKTVGSCNITL